jgi:hypothetical protein
VAEASDVQRSSRFTCAVTSPAAAYCRAAAPKSSSAVRCKQKVTDGLGLQIGQWQRQLASAQMHKKGTEYGKQRPLQRQARLKSPVQFEAPSYKRLH